MNKIQNIKYLSYTVYSKARAKARPIPRAMTRARAMASAIPSSAPSQYMQCVQYIQYCQNRVSVGVCEQEH